MSWFQDEMNAGDSYQEVADPFVQSDGGGGAVSQSEDYGYTITDAEIEQSLREVAFVGRDPATYSWAVSTAAAFNDDDSMKRQGAQNAAPGAQPKQEEKGLIGRITDFANQNKSLTEMVLKGIGGAVAEKNKGKAATDQLREKDRLEQARNAQYSASIAALAKPGIIGRAQPLKRTNGAPVFNNGRIA